jgi:GMP synthase (glutamine-hydrolysing)
VIADEKRGFYGLHVPPRGGAHARRRRKLMRNFVRKDRGCTGDWTMRAFREEAIEKIREQVGKGG